MFQTTNQTFYDDREAHRIHRVKSAPVQYRDSVPGPSRLRHSYTLDLSAATYGRFLGSTLRLTEPWDDPHGNMDITSLNGTFPWMGISTHVYIYIYDAKCSNILGFPTRHGSINGWWLGVPIMTQETAETAWVLEGIPPRISQFVLDISIFFEFGKKKIELNEPNCPLLIPSPVHTKHPSLWSQLCGNSRPKTMVSFRGCLVWTGDGINMLNNPDWMNTPQNISWETNKLRAVFGLSAWGCVKSDHSRPWRTSKTTVVGKRSLIHVLSIWRFPKS